MKHYLSTGRTAAAWRSLLKPDDVRELIEQAHADARTMREEGIPLTAREDILPVERATEQFLKRELVR